MPCSYADSLKAVGLNNTTKRKMFNYLHERLDSLESKLRRRTREHYNNDNNGFMSCILEVDIRQSGWRKAVLAILKSSQHLNKLLKTLEKKGRRVRIKNLRHGQCSENVYGPSLASYRAAPPGLQFPYHRRQRVSDQEVEDDETWPLSGEGVTCCSLM